MYPPNYVKPPPYQKTSPKVSGKPSVLPPNYPKPSPYPKPDPLDTSGYASRSADHFGKQGNWGKILDSLRETSYWGDHLRKTMIYIMVFCVFPHCSCGCAIKDDLTGSWPKPLETSGAGSEPRGRQVQPCSCIPPSTGQQRPRSGVLRVIR